MHFKYAGYFTGNHIDEVATLIICMVKISLRKK